MRRLTPAGLAGIAQVSSQFVWLGQSSAPPAKLRLTKRRLLPIFRAGSQDRIARHATAGARTAGVSIMKVRNSLKSLRSRHRNNQLVRRRGRVYVINKTQRRFKARQG